MTQLIQLKPSTRSVYEMINGWLATHPSFSPTFTQFLIKSPEAEIHLKTFAYYLSDTIRIFDVPLFEVCLTQAIKRYECSDGQGEEGEFDGFFEVLTYIAADLLHNIKIEDHQGCEWRVIDGIYFTDWFVLNSSRIKQLESKQIIIEPFYSEKQTVRRAQQILKNKICLTIC
ncbi:hypothetical protein JQC92_00845 [Shewanella sp. 202IG2-18]|uniref:hypothetical protein n=1 Tax=Parashewanella hymeniacidonis TaxID=2807618 RepID=UPI001960D6DA|nr:hypothetical protein [Parashewanella hymeniacidonis]MBM7070592.1 hypothetical protein [Parashewanella hymeniacidonis]